MDEEENPKQKEENSEQPTLPSPIERYRRSADEFEELHNQSACNHEPQEPMPNTLSNGEAASGETTADRSVPLSQRRNFTQSISAAVVGGAAGETRRKKTSLPTGDLGPAGDFERQNTSTTEEGVKEETENVVYNYFVSSQLLEQRHELGESEPAVALSPGSAGTSHIRELETFSGDGSSPGAIVGRRLAHLGDLFQQQHQSDLDSMVQMLLPQILSVGGATEMLNEAYDAFRSVARQLFRDGGINWGRVIGLLAFGYRMAVALFQRGVRGFVRTVIRLVVRFIVGERIAQWIAQQGGWGSSIDYRLDDMMPGWLGSFMNTAYTVVTAAAILAFVINLLRTNVGRQ